MAQARAELPNEACGLIIGSGWASQGGAPLRYAPCRNKAVSPYRATRQAIREDLIRFVEVHVCTSREVCIERDPKGLWAKALAGEIEHFTGVDDPYEPPLNPEVRVDLGLLSPEAAADQVLSALTRLGLLHTAARDPESGIQIRLEREGFTSR